MPKHDKKTAEIIANDDRVARFVDSDDWKVIRKSLIEKIVLNDSMSTLITTVAPEHLAIEVLARAQASTLLLDWLKEIEGRARQTKADAIPPTELTEQATENIMLYLEPEKAG